MWLCLKAYRKWYLWIRVMVTIHWLRWLIDEHVETGSKCLEFCCLSDLISGVQSLSQTFSLWVCVRILMLHDSVSSYRYFYLKCRDHVAVDTCLPFCSIKRLVNLQPGKDTTLLFLLIWENWQNVLGLTAPKPHIRAETGVSLFLCYYMQFI